MSLVKFASICDWPGCGSRSEEYVAYPSCKECQRDLCPRHQVKDSLDEERNNALCLACAAMKSGDPIN